MPDPRKVRADANALVTELLERLAHAEVSELEVKRGGVRVRVARDGARVATSALANAALLKYAATSGRGVDAVVVPATVPSTDTVTCVGVAPSSQSAAQPTAITLSFRRTVEDPAALVTLSTHPIGDRFAWIADDE